MHGLGLNMKMLYCMPCPVLDAAIAVKFEDPLGTALPAASQPFCDAWKRAEELLHGAPNVPMVCLKPAAETDKKGDEAASCGSCVVWCYVRQRTDTCDVWGLLCSNQIELQSAALAPQQDVNRCSCNDMIVVSMSIILKVEPFSTPAVCFVLPSQRRPAFLRCCTSFFLPRVCASAANPWGVCCRLLCPAGKGAAVSRELEGKLYAGHETFDWLLSIISYIISAEVCPLRSRRLRAQHSPPAALRICNNLC
jgi:hypothetical protein